MTVHTPISADLVSRQPLTSAFWDEIFALSTKHWHQQARHKEARPYDPDREKYFALEAAGLIRFYTLRRDGVLLGYATYLVLPKHLHYKTWSYATAETFFVDDAYGARGWGYLRLFRFAEQDLKALGCRSIVGHDRRDGLEPVYRRLGYELTERIYEKLL